MHQGSSIILQQNSPPQEGWYWHSLFSEPLFLSATSSLAWVFLQSLIVWQFLSPHHPNILSHLSGSGYTPAFSQGGIFAGESDLFPSNGPAIVVGGGQTTLTRELSMSLSWKNTRMYSWTYSDHEGVLSDVPGYSHLQHGLERTQMRSLQLLVSPPELVSPGSGILFLLCYFFLF